MGLFSKDFNKPGRGINKDEPEKTGAALFFSTLYRELSSLVLLNLLFLLFSIPIVTIVPAFIAATKITMKMVWDKPFFLFAEFRQAFMENLKHGIVLEVVLAAAGGITFYAVRYLLPTASASPLSGAALIFVFVVNFILLLSLMFIYPVVAVVDQPFLQQIKNSLILSIVCLSRSFAALAISAVLFGVSLLFFPLTLPIILLLLFSFSSFVISFFSWGGIEKYILKK